MAWVVWDNKAQAITIVDGKPASGLAELSATRLADELNQSARFLIRKGIEGKSINRDQFRFHLLTKNASEPQRHHGEFPNQLNREFRVQNRDRANCIRDYLRNTPTSKLCDNEMSPFVN